MKTILETERTFLVCMDPSHLDEMMALFKLTKKEVLDWIEENRLLQEKK